MPKTGLLIGPEGSANSAAKGRQLLTMWDEVEALVALSKSVANGVANRKQMVPSG